MPLIPLIRSGKSLLQRTIPNYTFNKQKKNNERSVNQPCASSAVAAPSSATAAAAAAAAAAATALEETLRFDSTRLTLLKMASEESLLAISGLAISGRISGRISGGISGRDSCRTSSRASIRVAEEASNCFSDRTTALPSDVVSVGCVKGHWKRKGGGFKTYTYTIMHTY